MNATRTRIKFCGITRSEDAHLACELGVDAIGLVFTRKSPRYVGLEQARAIRVALPPLVTVVALFMDDEPGWIEQVIGAVQPDILQFHGSEPPSLAGGFALPYFKAVPMGSVVDVASFAALHPAAAGLLLDSHAAGNVGGSGDAFDWSRIPRNLPRPLVLAGGLDATNVAQAIALVRPYAVDVSSGIESAPGVKHAARMRDFVTAVRTADSECGNMDSPDACD